MSTWVVTGANKGIGLELCRQLKARGDTVLALCRKSSAELTALGVEIFDGVDMANPASIAALASRIGSRRIDVLVNNAGILTIESLEDLDVDRMLEQYRVNTLGPLLTTRALRAQLASPGGKVAIVTSRVGSIADNGSGGMYGYRMSKAAVNMAGMNLSHDLRDAGITVLLLHPGMVATSMTGGAGIPPAQSAAGLLQRIDTATLAQSGTFWHANGEPLPW